MPQGPGEEPAPGVGEAAPPPRVRTSGPGPRRRRRIRRGQRALQADGLGEVAPSGPCRPARTAGCAAPERAGAVGVDAPSRAGAAGAATSAAARGGGWRTRRTRARRPGGRRRWRGRSGRAARAPGSRRRAGPRGARNSEQRDRRRSRSGAARGCRPAVRPAAARPGPRPACSRRSRGSPSRSARCPPGPGRCPDEPGWPTEPPTGARRRPRAAARGADPTIATSRSSAASTPSRRARATKIRSVPAKADREEVVEAPAGGESGDEPEDDPGEEHPGIVSGRGVGGAAFAARGRRPSGAVRRGAGPPRP